VTGPADPSALTGHRGSRLLGGPTWASRGVVVSVASTILFFTVVGFIVVNAPGWETFQQSFFDADVFAYSFPKILHAFWTNVLLFLTAEVFILPIALLIAVMRSLPGAVFTPIRVVSAAYTDVFRGIPGILVIYMLGLGVPSLGIEGVPTSEFFWAVIVLVLVYSAYVAEVYRAGIDSVHPSQEAAARSLGLSRAQSLRFVVLPQAVRRVIPPLLNDFIGLQKDTALISFIGIVEAFRESQIISGATFNLTPYVCAALLFLLVTIPLTRLVDWLIARDRRRYLAGAR
jgi:polar amino acid transport system permease protein